MDAALWDDVIEAVAAELAEGERRALVAWAADAPPSQRTRDALLDRLAAQRFGAAAAVAGARYIPASRTLEPGRAVVRAWLDGRVVEREVALTPVPLRRSAWEAARAPGGAAVAAQVVAEVRGEAEAEAQAAFESLVERIEALAGSLPAGEREAALAEAVEKLSNPTRSLRKLEKQFRQQALREHVAERAAVVEAIAPGVRVVDLGGALRFEAEREVELEVGGEPVVLRLVAEVHGVELERLFLSAPAEVLAAELVPALEVELERLEAVARATAVRIDDFVEERRRRPLYDVRALLRIVREEVHRGGAGAIEAAAERIRERAWRLDREAAERERVRLMVREHHLVAYKDYFPEARALGRELLLLVGPTNSGKTWQALNALAEAESGVYLAPLRLLALEGQEELELRGVAASFLTGEERDIRPGARFMASTIEMLDYRRVVEAAVIDEVQLLTDEDRGWAWCQAVVGVPAKRVIMTGSPDCVALVRALADYLGEPLTVVPLERYNPLEPIPEPVPLSRVEPGTAVIAFSRREVLELKARLEGRHTVAVIYGNLTPEVRREEARRFRSGEAQVLVATDAIAMGLNLPIRTVLFSTLRKFNGREEVSLGPAEILQIGGRAGRYGKHERGYVGALRRGDVARLMAVFAEGFTLRERPLRTRVRPASDHVELIAAGLDTPSLARTLETFQRGMTFDSPLLRPGVTDDMLRLAELADHYPGIPLAERLNLAAAPVDTRNPVLLGSFEDWLAGFAAGRSVRLPPPPPYLDLERIDDEALHAAEIAAKRLTVYAWLAYRWPARFPDLARCQEQREMLDRFIERGLAGRGRCTECVECGRRLPAGSRHATCRRCTRRDA